MDILWLLVGLTIGLLVAWVVLGARHRRRSARREAELIEDNRRTAEDLQRECAAHATAQRRLSELRGNETAARKKAETLVAELNATRAARDRERAASAAAHAKLASLQSESDGLAARLATAEADRAQRAVQLEARGDERRSQIADLRARVRERDDRIASLEAELAALQATMEPAAPARRAEPVPLHAEAGPPPFPAVPAGGAAGGAADDLTRIKGIGPVLKKKLNKIGITSFRQIADFTPADVERVNAVLDFRGRIEREAWVEQAQAITRPMTRP